MAGAFAIALTYLVLSIGTALTKLPFSDEGYYANPAFNLNSGRSMGTPVLETAGTSLRGLEQRTYWIMPLYIVTQAGMYKLFGTGLFQMRLLSTAWGLLIVFSWLVILRTLFEEKAVALLASALIALNFHVVIIGSVGRSDVMCAALGSAALAAYLWFRERDLAAAVFVSQALVVSSGLTHPNGIFYLGGTVVLMFHLDHGRIAWRHLAIAAVPYVIGGASWAAYILQDPSDFIAQFGGSASGRTWGLTSPLAALKAEITVRYLNSYGFGPKSAGLSRLKLLVLLAYIAGIAGALLTSRVRKHPSFRLLLVLTTLVFVMMALFEGSKQDWYLIHIIPLLGAVLAVWIHCCWKSRTLPASMLLLGVGSFIILNVGIVTLLIFRNDYQTRYVPAIRFLESKLDDHTLVMGSAELAFRIGFDKVKDDYRLGYYSRRRPSLIVVDENYEGWFRRFQTREPDVYRHIRKTLSDDARKVFESDYYRIYSLPPSPS